MDSMSVRHMAILGDVDSLVSFLLTKEVLDLPSQNTIPGFKNEIADGQTCTIEISTKHFYKALRYHCPEHYTDKSNVRFMGIVNFLNRYFHFYRPWCKPAQ